MEELSKIYKQMGEKFINELFNNYVIVTEKLSGSSFSFQRSGNGLSFYKGSSDKPISLIDRTLMMYYEKPIRHIESISKSVLTNIPENWRFCFQYFVNNNPIVVEYDNLPMNGLVLTHILVITPSGKTESIIDDPRVILDWSNILQVSPMIPIFSGYLSQKQKERIRNFISTPKEDHQEIFRTSSFAEFIIDILNPELETTLLQKNLKRPIDSIVFKFYKNNLSQTYSAKMVDPYTMNLMKSKEPIELRKAPADINEILLLDLLSFIEERGLRSSQLFSQTPNERYIELISNIFNDYVTKKGGDIKNLQIEKAKFVKGPEFDLNLDMIKNSTTQDLLNKSEVNRDLFKIMLGSFRKLRDPNKVGNILTPSVIGDFNKMVKKIKDETDKEVDTSFKTFNDYVSAKNESLNEKTVEELILEEKALRFNEFINLGKIIVEDNKTLIRNKKTGDEYEVKNPDPKKHEIIEPSDSYDKMKDVSDEKTLKGLGKINDVIKKQIADIKDPEKKENAEKVEKAMNVINDPSASSEEKLKLFGNLVEDGIITKNAGGTKFYVDTAKTGLFRKVLGDKSSPKIIQDIANEYGLDNIDREKSDRIPKKAMTGAKIFGDKKSNVNIKVNETGISFDSIDYKKQEIPSIDDLEKIYGSKEKAENAKRALEKYNAIIAQAQSAFKDSGNMEVLSAFPDTPPTSTENRTKLKNGTADIIADGFLSQFQEGKNPTQSQQKIIDDFKSLKDIKDNKEYDNKLMEITGKMMLDPFFKTGSADVVEMVSYMRELNKGNAVYMPSASNYPLGDIISISPEKIDFKKDSAEDIQRKIELIMTGVEARSIKQGSGGASASNEKTSLSFYKEFKNKDGKIISPEEVKSDLTEMSDKNGMYKQIFDGDIDAAINKNKEMAKKYDFDLEDSDYVSRKNKSVQSAVDYIKKKNPDINVDETKKKLNAYYDLGNIYAYGYNETVKEQLFTNEVWDVDKKTATATVNRTDGLNSLSKLKFEFNIGFTGTGRPSNPVPTRFKNVGIDENEDIDFEYEYEFE